MRPPELLAATAGLLLAVALFLPWFEFPGGREDAWNALTVAEIPAALAALGALLLVAVTVTQRSAALPLRVAVWTASVALIACESHDYDPVGFERKLLAGIAPVTRR